MLNDEHLALLRQGNKVWNAWRRENPDVKIDLSDADLTGAELRNAKLNGVRFRRARLVGADLSNTNLIGSDLSNADLSDSDLTSATLFTADLGDALLRRARMPKAKLNDANLVRADLSEAQLGKASLMKARLVEAIAHRADLSDAKMSEAILRQADFTAADLSRADLSNANLTATVFTAASLVDADLTGARLKGTQLGRANLTGADLTTATLLGVDLSNAVLNGCRTYGVSVWDSDLLHAEQANLIITPNDQPVITVDNLKVAQFIYLLLNNQEIRGVINTITSKVVLILGRFTPERKPVLDALRTELRRRDYTPILFDFEKAAGRSFIETVSTLAHMARFVIADVTDPKVVLQELQQIVPDLPSVPVQPLLLVGAESATVLTDFVRYPWFLKVHRYADLAHLLATLAERVIDPAEAKARELATPPLEPV